MTLLPLECLLQETAHLVGGVLLHLCRDVGVGVEGESRAIMAKDTRQGFDVYTILESECSECVPQIVEPQSRPVPARCSTRLSIFRRTIRLHDTAGRVRGRHIRSLWSAPLSVLFKDFDGFRLGVDIFR